MVTVHIPNIIREVKEEETTGATLEIQPFLTSEYLGENPRKRLFGGLAKTVDLLTTVPMIAPTRIEMEADGRILVFPNFLTQKNVEGEIVQQGNSGFYSPAKDTTTIGPLAMNFSYIIDDDHTYIQ